MSARRIAAVAIPAAAGATVATVMLVGSHGTSSPPVTTAPIIDKHVDATTDASTPTPVSVATPTPQVVTQTTTETRTETVVPSTPTPQPVVQHPVVTNSTSSATATPVPSTSTPITYTECTDGTQWAAHWSNGTCPTGMHEAQSTSPIPAAPPCDPGSTTTPTDCDPTQK